MVCEADEEEERVRWSFMVEGEVWDEGEGPSSGASARSSTLTLRSPGV